jgi:uncharacterized DUF497 family protein
VARITVDGFAFDERNTQKLREHRVSIREALEVLWNSPRAFRNPSQGGAPYVVIGPTHSGRMVTLPIDATEEPAIWRPRTGYPSSAREIRRYEQT